jgi:hypothetical protein
VGRLYDRKTKCADDYLSEAIVALARAAALAKHRRAEAKKQARIRAEQEELWQREKARRERELKRREYLTKKAESYEGYRRLVNATCKKMHPMVRPHRPEFNAGECQQNQSA